MMTQTLAVRLLMALILTVAAGLLPAQDAIRGWPQFVFDTDAFALPITAVVGKAGSNVAIVRADGRIYCNGQDSPFSGVCRPPDPPAGTRFVAVAVDNSSCLGLLSDGNLVFWGDSLSPNGIDAIPPLPPATRYVQAAVDNRDALALRSDGAVVGWGSGGMAASVPPIPPGVSVVSVYVGNGWAMMYLSSGNIVAWSYPGYAPNIPALPPGLTYVEVFPGAQHFFARRSDGVIVSWGDNTYGQCSLPSLPAGVGYVKLAPGGRHTVALRSDGVLAAWGFNTSGQCNVAQPAGGRTVAQIAANDGSSFALLSDGTVLCWGGYYMDGPPPPLLPGERWTDMSYFQERALGVTSSGRLLGWGNPVANGLAIPPLPANVHYTRAVTGWLHCAALRDDGELVAWGYNPDGRCSVPPRPPGAYYTHVALGDLHTVALLSNGQAVAFGDPAFGETSIPSPLPGTQYVDADAVYSRTVLLRSDNVVVNCGDLSPGPSYWAAPSLPAGVSYVQVAAARYQDAALRSDGELVVWGQWVPTWPPLPSGVCYVEIAAGYHHFLARRSDGQVTFVDLGAQHGEDRLPPVRAGESVVQVHSTVLTAAVRVGPTCTYVSFATGCAGSLPSARLVPRDTPRIGSTLEVNIFGLPTSTAFMALGLQRLGPIALDTLGLPGCSWQIRVDAAVAVSGANGHATFRLPIPNRPEFVGLQFFNQALVLDPAANGFGAVVSAAAEGIIGYP